MKDEKKEKKESSKEEEKISTVGKAVKAPLVCVITVEDAMAIQKFLQKHPLEQVLNLFMPLSNAINAALDEA